MNPFLQFQSILQNYIHDKEIAFLPMRWSEKHRHYHTIDHLIQVILDVEKDSSFAFLNVYEKHAILLAAFFHDAIYDPKAKDNEDKSIELFKRSFKNKDPRMVNAVCGIIACTKYRKKPIDKLQRIFWEADNKGFLMGYNALLKNELLIRKEYSYFSNKEYKEGRINFLNTCKGLFNSSVDKDIDKLISFVEKSY